MQVNREQEERAGLLSEKSTTVAMFVVPADPTKERYHTLADKPHKKSFCWSPPLLSALSLLLLILPHPAESQQTASLSIPLFTKNRTLSHRQNVCDRAQAFDFGTRDDGSLRYALEGMQLNVAADLSDYFRYKDGILNKDYPGLVAVLLDEVAYRGKFTWRDSFAVFEDGPGDSNHTWTEFLLFQTENFDLAADWWLNTVARAKLGVAFPEGWYDGSYILVAARGSPKKTKNDVNWWGWLLPFQPDVWTLIVFTLLWSGLVYMFLEYLAYPGQYTGKRARQSFGNDIFLSMLLFTQHFQFVPKTPASRILATSMALWALLISSAYTANLASFFVDQNQQNYEVTSLEEAVQLGKPICVWDTVPNAIYVQQKYPSGIYVRLKEEEDLYVAVNNGVCALAVTTMTSYQGFAKKKDINPDCTLDWVGTVIKPSMAGFATKTDAGRKCTSLVHDVVNLHLLEMEADGTLDQKWSEHYTKTVDHFCAATSTEEDEDSQRMSVHEMGGTFAFHFGVSLFAIALGVFTKFWKVYQKRQRLYPSSTPTPFKKGNLRLPPTWKELDKTVEMDLPTKKNGDDDMDRSGTQTSFLEDFWAETSESRLLSFRSRPSTRKVGGLDSLELMELLQDEFDKQQNQLEEKLQEQLSTLIDQKMQRQQNQMEQRIEQMMQQQFAMMMEVLKENQRGGSARSNHHRPAPVPRNASALTNSTASITDDEEDDSHGCENNRSKVQQQNSKSMPAKGNQISHLLYPHEVQELRGATAEYFITSDDDMSIQESTSGGVRLRKVKSIDAKPGNDTSVSPRKLC